MVGGGVETNKRDKNPKDFSFSPFIVLLVATCSVPEPIKGTWKTDKRMGN
jgi:hypothetical protein